MARTCQYPNDENLWSPALEAGIGFANLQSELLAGQAVSTRTSLEHNVPDDMRRAIEDYRRKSNLIVETFVDSIKDMEPPDTIYHYTDSSGLLGIVNAGTIRLTDILGLNDPSELHHGVNRARTILAEEAKSGHPAGNVFARQFDRIMNGALDNIATFFVACFSRNGDELGQWRAYGDDGHGFALAFDRSSLERAFAGPDSAAVPNNSTFPRTYNDARLKGNPRRTRSRTDSPNAFAARQKAAGAGNSRVHEGTFHAIRSLRHPGRNIL